MKKIILFILLLTIPFIQSNVENTTHYTKTIKYYSNNSNSYLTNVSFENVNFRFEKQKFSYQINVPYSKSTLGLSYTAEDPNAIVEVIGSDELHVGNNSLVIIVTATDGTVVEYDFTINRSDDNSSVSNNIDDIINNLESDNSSQITVYVEGDSAINIAGDTLDALKNSKKMLTYTWQDKNGNFLASLKIDSQKIDNDNPVNPNIKETITNEKLLEYLGSIPHLGISTVNTNIPKNSVYSITVTGNEDLYYLYYYDEEILNTKPLRNIDGKIEFEVEDGYDYAIVSESKRPIKDVIGFGWLIPSLIAIAFITVCIIVGRKLMIKSMKNKYSSSKKQENNKNNN